MCWQEKKGDTPSDDKDTEKKAKSDKKSKKDKKEKDKKDEDEVKKDEKVIVSCSIGMRQR